MTENVTPARFECVTLFFLLEVPASSCDTDHFDESGGVVLPYKKENIRVSFKTKDQKFHQTACTSILYKIHCRGVQFPQKWLNPRCCSNAIRHGPKRSKKVKFLLLALNSGGA